MKKNSKTRFLAICLTLLMTLLSHLSWAESVVTYTTSDGQLATLNPGCLESIKNFYNSSIVSHVYQNGKGTITFDREITCFEGVFSGCSTLTSVSLPLGVTIINAYEFKDCKSLSSVSIPSTVKSILIEAFSGCSSLSSIKIPSSVTSIGYYAFEGCNALTSIYVSGNVAKCESFIPGSDSPFSSIINTCTLYVPKGYKEQYQNAPVWRDFQNIVELNSNIITYTSSDGQVITPKNATTFGANIVSNVYKNGKGTITFDGEVTCIDTEAFRDCRSLTSIDIPSSVSVIYRGAFHGCSSLTSIDIPSSVSRIHVHAFYGCIYEA